MHILSREKLQNSLICNQVLKHVLNYEVVPPRRAGSFCSRFLLLLLFSPAVLDWITIDHKKSVSVSVDEREEIAWGARGGCPNQPLNKNASYGTHNPATSSCPA